MRLQGSQIRVLAFDLLDPISVRLQVGENGRKASCDANAMGWMDSLPTPFLRAARYLLVVVESGLAAVALSVTDRNYQPQEITRHTGCALGVYAHDSKQQREGRAT